MLQVESERVAKRGCEAELEQLRQSLDADSEALREELRQEMDRSTTDKRQLKEQLHVSFLSGSSLSLSVRIS